MFLRTPCQRAVTCCFSGAISKQWSNRFCFPRATLELTVSHLAWKCSQSILTLSLLTFSLDFRCLQHCFIHPPCPPHEVASCHSALVQSSPALKDFPDHLCVEPGCPHSVHCNSCHSLLRNTCTPQLEYNHHENRVLLSCSLCCVSNTVNSGRHSVKIFQMSKETQSSLQPEVSPLFL